MSIDRYIMTVRSRLALLSPPATEVTEELRAHLEDAACDLQMAGLDPDASEREAVRRFGAPEEIVSAIVQARDAERCRRRTRGLRVGAAALLVAAALAALGGGAVASAHTPGPNAPGTVGVGHRSHRVSTSRAQGAPTSWRVVGGQR